MIETTPGPLEHSASLTFRPDVEGLRAVAILLVVAFHVGIPGWPGGFIGVDVFFVVSGYLITSLLVYEIETTGRLDILRFYARRARRLLPAFAVMLVATVLVGEFLFGADERVMYTRAAFAASLYASNIWFQLNSPGYFGGNTADNPFLHTWSLAVEEQFYLVWPLVIVLAFTRLRSKRALVVVMAALSILSFGACLWLVSKDPQTAFFSSPGRAWEFGIGGLAALITPWFVQRFGPFGGAVSFVGLLTIFLSTMLFDSGTAFPRFSALLPVVGTGAVLMAGTSLRKGAAASLLRLRPMQYIGRLSYSWYLWHWPVLILGAAALPGLELPGRIGLAALSLGIAAMCHVLVENPIRYNRYLAAKPMAMLCLAAAITVVTVAVSRMGKSSAEIASATPLQRAVAQARRGVPPGLYGTGCFLDYPVAQPKECVFGDRAGPTAIVLFGDSHAAQWFSAFDTIAKEQRWRLIVLTKAGCPTSDVEVRRWSKKRQSYPECSSWRAAALERIVNLRPAVVFLGNSDNHVTRQGDAGAPRLDMQEWQAGTRRTLEHLSAAGLRTVTLRDTPGPGLDVPQCLARAEVRKQPISRCTMPRLRAVRDDVFQASQGAALGLANASMLDLTTQFCSETACPPILGGEIVYGDPGHIANGFARSLAGVISNQIVPSVENATKATLNNPTISSSR